MARCPAEQRGQEIKGAYDILFNSERKPRLLEQCINSPRRACFSPFLKHSRRIFSRTRERKTTLAVLSAIMNFRDSRWLLNVIFLSYFCQAPLGFTLSSPGTKISFPRQKGEAFPVKRKKFDGVEWKETESNRERKREREQERRRDRGKEKRSRRKRTPPSYLLRFRTCTCSETRAEEEKVSHNK